MKKISELTPLDILILFCGVILITTAFYAARLSYNDPHFLGSLTAVLFALIGGGIGAYKDAKAKKSAEERIEHAEQNLKSEPAKAKPAWDLARLTLEAYFQRNLAQISWIFWLSILVMLAGFGTVLWGVEQAINLANTGENLSSLNALPPIIAGLSGVITEFIGATFLFIYRSTIQQAALYSKTLERINSVGMAMQILDTMPDDTKKGDLKSETKAKLVELLVRGANEQGAEQEKPKAKRAPKSASPQAE